VFTAKTIVELKSHLSKLDVASGIALVPTMGALHQGHMALVQRAVNENSVAVVSVFDRIVIFAPSTSEIYPNGQYSESYDFGGLEKVMEGAFRKGHFDGVGTIVEKLLLLVRPDRAYFGEKDFQQLQIIRKLVQVKEIPVEIIGCPIVREHNGLAMSSRNERLSKKMRNEASFIFKTLQTAKKKFGTESALTVVNWAEKQFEEHADLELEYLIIADIQKLRSVTRKRPKTKYRIFVVVYAEGVRLIDNIALN